MKNEELYIRKRMGSENPFRVPEGYFDSLAAEVMGKLPGEALQPEPSAEVVELQPAASPRRVQAASLRPWLYAAACAVVAVVTATLYFFAPVEADPGAVASAPVEDSYVEDMADYVMADNIDIYACLAGDY